MAAPAPRSVSIFFVTDKRCHSHARSPMRTAVVRNPCWKMTVLSQVNTSLFSTPVNISMQRDRKMVNTGSWTRLSFVSASTTRPALPCTPAAFPFRLQHLSWQLRNGTDTDARYRSIYPGRPGRRDSRLRPHPDRAGVFAGRQGLKRHQGRLCGR